MHHLKIALISAATSCSFQRKKIKHSAKWNVKLRRAALLIGCIFTFAVMCKFCLVCQKALWEGEVARVFCWCTQQVCTCSFVHVSNKIYETQIIYGWVPAAEQKLGKKKKNQCKACPKTWTLNESLFWGIRTETSDHPDLHWAHSKQFMRAS